MGEKLGGDGRTHFEVKVISCSKELRQKRVGLTWYVNKLKINKRDLIVILPRSRLV